MTGLIQTGSTRPAQFDRLHERSKASIATVEGGLDLLTGPERHYFEKAKAALKVDLVVTTRVPKALMDERKKLARRSTLQPGAFADIEERISATLPYVEPAEDFAIIAPLVVFDLLADLVRSRRPVEAR